MVSPILIAIYVKSRKAGYVTLLSLTLLCSVITFFINSHYGFGPVNTGRTDVNQFDIIYIKPWCRFNPYGVGALFGWLYFEFKNQNKYNFETPFNKLMGFLSRSSLLSWIFFFIGVSIFTFLYFIMSPFYGGACEKKVCWSMFMASLYAAGARGLFVFGLALVIFPTFVGKLTFLRGFLSADLFTVLARLNYCGYIWHGVVMAYFLLPRQHSNYFTNTEAFVMLIGFTFFVNLFSIGISLICEVPFMNLEKIYLMPQQEKEKDFDNKQNSLLKVKGD
jgi:hypothetical protein